MNVAQSTPAFIFITTRLAPPPALSATADEAAVAFCQCNQAEIALTEKIMDAFYNGDTGRMLEKNQELEAIQDRANACRRKLREKYAGQNEAFATEVNARMDKLCPYPVWSGAMPTMGGVGGSPMETGSMEKFLREQGPPGNDARQQNKSPCKAVVYMNWDLV